MPEIEVRNPATGKPVGSVVRAEPGDFGRAEECARAAQPAWAAQTFAVRAAVVRRFHDRLLDQSEQVLDLIQSETGKARRDAFAEIVSVAGTARYYLAHGGEHLSVQDREPAFPFITGAEILHKPHGVVGLITPWNYPFLLAIGDAIPALLAGNAVIVKPSELAPLSANLAKDLFVAAGLDDRLLTILHG